MNHPLKRATRRDDFAEIEALAEAQERTVNDVMPAPSWLRQTFRPEEPAMLARRYGARYEPVRAGHYDDDENNFDRAPYQWGSTSLRDRVRGGDDHRASRKPPGNGEARHDRRHESGHPARGIGRLSMRQSFAVASLGAVIAGGSIGLAASQIDFGSTSLPQTSAVAAVVEPVSTAALAVVPAAPAAGSGKSVLTASLDVSDISGALNQMIPLGLQLAPAVEGQKLALRIRGLPEAAYLTAGTRQADDWVLQPGQEKAAKLVVPEAAASTYQIEVSALEAATGELAAPAKIMNLSLDNPAAETAAATATANLAIYKQPAPPNPELPAPIPAASEQATDVGSLAAADLVRKGDILLKAGDLAAARQFYQEAFEQGAIEGAVGAAKTYDPAVYAELNVQGLQPDPAKALDWYKKAGTEGGAEITKAVARLAAQ